MIIRSILDTDLYKFTMMQAVLHKFPATTVKYKFKSRGDQKLGFMWEEVREAIRELARLRLQDHEAQYLSSLRFFTPDFIDFLRIFRFNSNYVTVNPVDDDQDLEIEIKGPWLHTILYEVPVLAIVSEIYSQHLVTSGEHGRSDDIFIEGRRRLAEKLDLLADSWQFISMNFSPPLSFADFGTRRRFSSSWHEQVILDILNWQKERPINHFVGTSNVYLAMQHGLKPIGTMAHEWLQAGQAMDTRLDLSQKLMLETWCSEYRGDLGIALTDVIGMDAFLKDFDLYLAKLFDGCRHDSGCPREWCSKLIAHYKKLGLDPLSKTAVFSDGLDFQTMIDLYKEFGDKIRVSFGIGTNLTNDLGIDPLKIVMKIVECNGRPVAKISDSPGKGMCEDPEYVQQLRKVYGLEYDFGAA